MSKKGCVAVRNGKTIKKYKRTFPDKSTFNNGCKKYN